MLASHLFMENGLQISYTQLREFGPTGQPVYFLKTVKKLCSPGWKDETENHSALKK